MMQDVWTDGRMEVKGCGGVYTASTGGDIEIEAEPEGPEIIRAGDQILRQGLRDRYTAQVR